MESENNLSPAAQECRSASALLGALALALGMLFLTKLHPRRNAASQSAPSRQNPEGICAGSTAEPAPHPTDAASQKHYIGRRKRHTPLWKKLVESAVGLGTVGLLIVNLFLLPATKKAANAAKASADAEQNSLVISQQAHVVIGRADGKVADIIMPKDANGKAGIMVYFQNSGHLPAQFNWGAASEIIPTFGFPTLRTDHFYRPMWRAIEVRTERNTKGVEESGYVVIGGDSSYQGLLWEVPKSRMIKLIDNASIPFQPGGRFDYCDGFGSHICYDFDLLYLRSPYNRFVLIDEKRCSAWEMQVLNPDPKLQYLPPCQIESNRQELKWMMPHSPAP